MSSKLLLITVIVLNAIAFGLAVAAERRRTKSWVESDENFEYHYCKYGSDIATGFGVGAFLFLLVSQLTVMVASRCFCCGKPLSPVNSRTWAIILFLIYWLCFLIAEVCLLAGSVRNAYHTKYSGIFDNVDLHCDALRRGVFASGAAFIFFNTITAILYYICYSDAGDRAQPYIGEVGLAMATYK